MHLLAMRSRPTQPAPKNLERLHVSSVDHNSPPELDLMADNTALRHSSALSLWPNWLPESHCNLVRPPNNMLTYCAAGSLHILFPSTPCSILNHFTPQCRVGSCCAPPTHAAVGYKLDGWCIKFSPDPFWSSAFPWIVSLEFFNFVL